MCLILQGHDKWSTNCSPRLVLSLVPHRPILLYHHLPALSPAQLHRPWGQSIGDFGQNMATGILKSVGQLGGLPHSVAQIGDVVMDLFASPRNNLADLAAGQPPASSSSPAATPMMAPGPGWLTRHTYSPEDINSGLFGGINALNQATGGKAGAAL